MLRRSSIALSLILAPWFSHLTHADCQPGLRFRRSTLTVGTGTSVIIPENPIHPDGSVNFIFNIRGVERGDRSPPTLAGTRAVLVTAENGSLNRDTYGSHAFLNRSIQTILTALRKEGAKKAGSVCLSTWSAGYDAAFGLLLEQMQREQAGTPVTHPVHCVTFSDGMNHPLGQDKKPLEVYVWFAKKAFLGESTPEGRPYSLTIAYSAIPRWWDSKLKKTFSSAADFAHRIASALGIDLRSSLDTPASETCPTQPLHQIFRTGRLSWWEIFPVQWTQQGYPKQDTYSLDALKKQHMTARALLPCLWSKTFCSAD